MRSRFWASDKLTFAGDLKPHSILDQARIENPGGPTLVTLNGHDSWDGYAEIIGDRQSFIRHRPGFPADSGLPLQIEFQGLHLIYQDKLEALSLPRPSSQDLNAACKELSEKSLKETQ